jgi:hypothetical protein
MSQDKILFIMGNGPSLKEIMTNPDYLDVIRNNHSFGLNAAYRAYEKYNFYPTYFGCFDYVVNDSHKEAFESLVLSDNSIQKFYFIGTGEKKQHLYKEQVVDHEKFQKINFRDIGVSRYPGISLGFDKYVNSGSSGSNATQIGIMLGYKRIVLLGCDCNYVEKLKEVVHCDKLNIYKLMVTNNIETNPNYWFDDYQQVGDKFNVPCGQQTQLPSWKNIYRFCPPDVKIVNCSEISKISYFEKQPFTNYLK